ncbi:hypothetical protein [Streptomyces chartreusis]
MLLDRRRRFGGGLGPAFSSYGPLVEGVGQEGPKWAMRETLFVAVELYPAAGGGRRSGCATGIDILFARADGKGGMPDLLKARNYAEHPVEVKAKSGSDIYFVARVKVTGPIEGALKGCHFWYRQGSQQYQQQMECSTIVSLGPPLKYEK